VLMMTYERTLEELVNRIVAREFKLDYTPTSSFEKAVQTCGRTQARINDVEIPDYSHGPFKGDQLVEPTPETVEPTPETVEPTPKKRKPRRTPPVGNRSQAEVTFERVRRAHILHSRGFSRSVIARKMDLDPSSIAYYLSLDLSECKRKAKRAQELYRQSHALRAEGLTHAQIAERLGVSEAYVLRTLRRKIDD
jgi:predicted transcriptional regulator